MMTTDELAAIRARHRQQLLGYSYGNVEAVPYCFHCSETWPCDAATLLAALDAAEAERDVLRGQVAAANERARLLLKSKNMWMARAQEATNE